MAQRSMEEAERSPPPRPGPVPQPGARTSASAPTRACPAARPGASARTRSEDTVLRRAPGGSASVGEDSAVVVDEVLQRLAAADADLEVRLKISDTTRDGVSDDVVCTVSEKLCLPARAATRSRRPLQPPWCPADGVCGYLAFN